MWRVLGFDYQILLNKIDFTLLINDMFTTLGERTYDNAAKGWQWINAPLNIGNYCSIVDHVNFIVDEGFYSMPTITN